MSNTAIITGRTDTRTGTLSILMDAWATNAVVKTYEFTPKVPRGDEPDPSGFTGTTIILNDGWDASLKCLFDTSIEWPAIGDIISVQNPYEDSPRSCLVESVTPSGGNTPAEAATITIKCDYRPNRALGGQAPPP
jgi:hypothetical protein